MILLIAEIVRNYANYMLIFQHHLPHVIPNSMQALRALSHSEITYGNTKLTVIFTPTHIYIADSWSQLSYSKLILED